MESQNWIQIAGIRETAPLTPVELGEVLGALQSGAFQPTSGGFSPVKRGIVRLSDGRKVFGKLAIDEQTGAWIRKEAQVYKFLNGNGYSFAPTLLGDTKEMIVLPDLSAWDWSARWSTSKVQAVFAAMRQLTELKVPNEIKALLKPQVGVDCVNNWQSLLEQRLWEQVVARAAQFEPNSDNFRLVTEVSSNQLSDWSGKLRLDMFERNELAHLDVRSDNIAFNSESGEVLLVDWNWTELSCGTLDRTLFALSLFDQTVTGMAPLEIEAQIDPLAALAAAGVWFYSCVQPPFKPGDPDKLRPYQFRMACLALRQWMR